MTPPATARKPAGKAAKKGKKGLARYQQFLLGAAALLLALLLLLLLLVFSPHPRYPVPGLTAGDVVFQQRILWTESPKVLRGRPGEVSELELTPEEVRSVMRLVANGINIARLFRPGSARGEGAYNDFQLSYRDDGVVEIDAVHNTGYAILFGGHLRIFVTGRPDITDGELSFAVREARVGRLPFSSSVADAILRRVIERNTARQDVQDLHRIVREVTVDPDSGRVKVAYLPHELRKTIGR